MPDSTTASFAILIAVIATFVVVRLKTAGRRAKALRSIAHQLGFTVEGADWSSSSRAPQLESPLFERGTEKRFENIMSGTRDGMTTNFFDYIYRGADDVVPQTVAAFTQDIWLPTFELGPRPQRSQAASRKSREGIEFSFSQEFSEKFRLSGADEERIRKFFTRREVHILNELGPGLRWHFEASHFTLILYRAGETVRPADYAAWIEETTQLAKNFLGIF